MTTQRVSLPPCRRWSLQIMLFAITYSFSRARFWSWRWGLWITMASAMVFIIMAIQGSCLIELLLKYFFANLSFVSMRIDVYRFMLALEILLLCSYLSHQDISLSFCHRHLWFVILEHEEVAYYFSIKI